MEIIDSQIHVPMPVGPWDPRLDQAGRDAMAVELGIATMDAVGIDAAVIPAPLPFVDLAVKLHPKRFAGMLVVPATMPDMANQVALIRTRPGFLGIRIIVSWPPTGEGIESLRAGAWEPAFAVAEQRQIPVALFIPGHLEEVLPIVKAHPDLGLMIDHFGFRAPPRMKLDHPPFKNLPSLLQLAQFPNVTVKFSGAPALSREPYPFLDLWPSLHRVIDAFGPERLMWGSDFPRCNGLHLRSEAVNYLLYSNEVSAREKELMFGMNLRRIMRWPKIPERPFSAEDLGSLPSGTKGPPASG